MTEKRITWSKPDGSWGIDGVELSTLSPRVYGALCKLKQMEDEAGTVERMAAFISKFDVDEAICKSQKDAGGAPGDCEEGGRDCISCIAEFFGDVRQFTKGGDRTCSLR